MAAQWTLALRPAELALRDWVRPRLDAPTIRAMAELDHGMRVDEHRRGIEELLVARHLPAELPWTPREVLELARHDLAHGHAARLFACLVLVRWRIWQALAGRCPYLELPPGWFKAPRRR